MADVASVYMNSQIQISNICDPTQAHSLWGGRAQRGVLTSNLRVGHFFKIERSGKN